MGRVYKAEHVLMRRLVALKVIGTTDDDADAERQAAFQREIEAAARLSHPNVVAAYDAGEANGVRFLVMEYVDGVDLDRLVREVGRCRRAAPRTTRGRRRWLCSTPSSAACCIATSSRPTYWSNTAKDRTPPGASRSLTWAWP